MANDSGRLCVPAIESPAENARETSVVSMGGQICPPVCFAIMARDLWGTKAPTVIGVQYRGREPNSDFSTERRWCRAEGDAPAQVLIDMLRGPEGLAALNRIMRDRPPPWWRSLQVAMACSAAYEEQRAKFTKE